jgi:2-aminobenzoate-CoA ligase
LAVQESPHEPKLENSQSRWSTVVAQNLPPRELWPTLVYGLPALQYPQTLNLTDELFNNPRVDRDTAAVFFRNEMISYEDLHRRVLAFAARLIRIGVKPSDRVALRLANCPALVVAWLAVQWIGAICVQISPLYRRREIEHVVNHSGATVIICGVDLIADVEAARHNFVSRVIIAGVEMPDGDRRAPVEDLLLIEDVRDESALAPPPYPMKRDDPAVITYIAKADGALKGVVHSPADILASADTYAAEILKLTPTDVCIGTMSLSWAFGLGALLIFPFRAGAATVLLESGPVSLLTAIAGSRATVLFGVPTMYRMLLRHPGLESFDLSALRCCVSSAEPLPTTVVEEWRARTGLEILNGLGSTELTHIFISARPGAVRPGLVGTPVAGYEARIVDETFHEVPHGVAGQLAIRGPSGARYWRDSDEQRRAVHDGWTLTGDVCIRHSDGWFQFVRRIDNLIVSAGYKVSISEVERVLEEHPSVARARVFSVPDSDRGAVPKATVVPVRGRHAGSLAEELRQYLKSELAPFKCPREIQVLAE